MRFAEWLTLNESQIEFLGSGWNPSEREVRKFIATSDGRIVVGQPHQNHIEIIREMGDVNSHSIYYGDLSRFGIILRDNGVPLSFANRVLTTFAKEGIITPRMTIRMPDDEILSGSDVLANTHASTTPSFMPGVQLRRDRVLSDPEKEIYQTHSAMMQRALQQSNDRLKSVYRDRNRSPKDWFYRHPGG